MAIRLRRMSEKFCRLQKDDCLAVYDMNFGGRNRRYYKITERGAAQLNLYQNEWKNYSSRITRLFEEGCKNE